MNRDSLYPEIGRRLKVRRDQLKKTQEAVSKKLGISRASLANIEAGRQNILVHQLYALAEVLDIELSNLLPMEKTSQNDVDDQLTMPDNINSAQALLVRQMIQPAITSTKLNTGGRHAKRRD